MTHKPHPTLGFTEWKEFGNTLARIDRHPRRFLFMNVWRFIAVVFNDDGTWTIDEFATYSGAVRFVRRELRKVYG